MSKKAKLGDVFLLPLDEQRSGIGQIAGDWNGELYVVVYDKLVSSDALPIDLVGIPLLLAALTLDAKFYHGDWRIVGNLQESLGSIPQPWFKVSHGPKFFIESRDRSSTRPATALEAAKLRLRTVVAPVRVESAFKAMHGIGDWNSRYDHLRPAYVIESARLITG